MTPDKCIGIDLGTTNSVAAILDPDDMGIHYGMHGPQRGPVLPSAVAYDPASRRLIVGAEARARRGLMPQPILSVKRGMGKTVTSELAGKSLSPPDVSALILKHLVTEFRAALTERKLNFDVRRAIVTVPAHFQQPAMEATTRAGQQAGLEVVELLHEPTAAAIHFCWVRACRNARAGQRAAEREETLLVFDLGGGTFDVSIIKKVPNPTSGADYQTLAIAGDSFLGGDNFDEEIARELLRRVVRSSNRRIASDNPGHPSNLLRYAKLLALAESIKIKLTDAAHVDIEERNYLLDDGNKPLDVVLRVTRTELDTLLEPVANRTVPFCEEALEEARLGIDQIDTILMVGGSSKLPLMAKLVKRRFCEGPRKARCAEPIVHFPDLCVGAGAALKAASLGRLYRPSDKTVVLVRGYGGHSSTTGSLLVEVTQDPDKAPLKNASARLAGREGGEAVGRIVGTSRALFDRVVLAAERANFYTLSLRSSTGRELAGFDVGIRHDPYFVPPLGSSTSANVLSYTLSLEVMDTSRGELRKVELAARLTPLPDEFTYHFRCPANAEQLLFPIYGDSQLIKEIHIPMPRGVRPGADIDLVVTLQANQQVRCRGLIPEAGADPFEFRVEPPAPEPVPTRDEYRELCARADAVLAQYSRKDAGRKAAHVYRLRAEIERAFETNDEARLIQRFRELKNLVDEMDPANLKVDPPLEKLEELAQNCYAALDELPPESTLPREEMREDVDCNVSLAHTSAEKTPPDQETYARCYANLERNFKALIEEFTKHDKQSPEEEAVGIIRYANQMYAEVATLPLDAGDQRLADQAARASIDKAEAALATAPKEAARHAQEAIRILNQILKKHDTEGRISDDGSGIKRVETGAAPGARRAPPAAKGDARTGRTQPRHGDAKG